MEIQTPPRQKLPIGIQDFAKLREKGCYYVDKTAFALRLIEEGGYYFLSRPRRFGKSLFVDTLKELFEGNQALFTGLYAEQHWDWAVKYPVIRLSFGSGILQSRAQLDAAIVAQLSQYEKTFAIAPVEAEIPYRFKHLIRSVHQHTGQRVVVLVDEYDKPTLDNLSTPDLAREMRNGLRNLYSVLKDSDAHLKFVFFTGVSKFSKVSLFSELNNLNDITLDREYSSLCGYTDEDIDTVFAAELPGLDRGLIRTWYNGYNWRGTTVYNPFDVLLLFQKREFRAYWFETGTPTFLVELLSQRQWFTPDLAQREVDDNILSTFDVDKISTEALLWQTGYLTFKQVTETMPGFWLYTLGYPNREVEAALNGVLLSAYGPEPQPALVARSHLYPALLQQDTDALRKSFHALFASMPRLSSAVRLEDSPTAEAPNDWYRSSPLAQFEGHYASVFYSQLAALGLNVRGEDVTNRGRIDLSLQLAQTVYLFEFKVVATEANGTALQQLLARGYAEKYRAPGVTILLIGVEFSRTERNIVGWDVYREPETPA